MSTDPSPIRLNLKKDQKLDIDWSDGRHSAYSISLLRSLCPCAQCKEVRKESEVKKNKPTLRILPGNYAQPLTVVSAELVGNYALRLEWSDGHGTGIYSFAYLREIAPSP